MVTAQFMVTEAGKPAGLDVYHTTTQEAVDRLGRHLNETGEGKSYSLAHVTTSDDKIAEKLPVA